jgi:hypothetical protein
MAKEKEFEWAFFPKILGETKIKNAMSDPAEIIGLRIEVAIRKPAPVNSTENEARYNTISAKAAGNSVNSKK